MRSLLLLLAVSLLLAGCDYDAPLSTEHVVPVDRAFFVDLGGHRCLQLEDLGSGAGQAPEHRCYFVGRYDADGDDSFTLSLINDRRVPRGSKTTAELQAAFLAAPDLFEPIARFRRRLLPAADDLRATLRRGDTAAGRSGRKRLIDGGSEWAI